MNKKNLIYTGLAALLLVVVAILFFAPADFEGKVLQQHDMMQGVANGQEGKAFTEATGETTRWTNSLFSGMPNFQISPSYSANSMLGWVAKLYTLWLPSPANLLFSMMLGFFIMCLCLKMKWPTALFAAVAWGFSTYFIIIIGAGHIWKFLTLSYIPPMIGGIALCYRKKYLYGTALTALFAALQLGSNHPQMTYYFLFVIAALVIAWLVIAIREKQVKSWVYATLCIIGAGGLGVVANCASLYNSYEYAKETVRGKATELKSESGQPPVEGMDKAAITQWSYGIGETFSLLIPNVKGGASLKPEGGENKIMSVLDTDKGASFYLSPEEGQVAGQFTQYFGDQPMTNGPVYVGAFVLMLAILAMFVVDEGNWAVIKWALFAVSVLAILLAWGHNFDAFSSFFIDNFPAYNKFRAVSSILVIVEFCIPLLAAMAIIKMIRTPDFMTRYRWTFYTVMGAGLFICFLGWIFPSMFGQPWSMQEIEMLQQQGILSNPMYSNILNTISESRLSLVSTDSLRSLLFILLGSLVCYLYLKGAFRNKAVFACALTAVVLIDLFTVNRRYVDNDNFVEPVYAQSSLEMTDADKQILQDKDPNYRVLDVDEFGGARSSYFHKTIGGYHAAKLTRYNDLIDRQISRNNPAVLNMLNTKYIISQGQVVQNPDALGNAWFVEKINYVNGPDAEMAGLDSLDTRHMAVADASFRKVIGEAKAKAEGDTIYETTYAPNKLTYKSLSKNGGVALFSEIFFPWGWEATIDGKPAEIGRANYVLRALNIPAGSHEIVFRFDPKSIRVADTFSMISIILIYVLCAGAIAYVAWNVSRSRKQVGIKTEEKNPSDK